MWAIDAGTSDSAIVEWDGEHIRHAKILPNELLVTQLRAATILSGQAVVIEDLSCYGMRVGCETFSTLKWMGRFDEAATHHGAIVTYIERRKVVEHFGVTGKGKDSALIVVLKSRFGEKKDGVTTKLKSHLWQAFALAVCAMDQKLKRDANAASRDQA